MSGRLRGGGAGPQHSLKGGGLGGLPPPMDMIPGHPYARGPLGPPLPHPGFFDDIREPPPSSFPRGPLPPHAAMMEERLAAQHQEIQALLLDNQRLAATHVALKQELAAAQQELQHLSHVANNMQAEKDMKMRELQDRSIKMEGELRATDALRNELVQVRADIQKLSASRQELNSQVQALMQDLSRASADLQKAPALNMEIETMKQELQRARAAIDYEKKAHAENFEQGQAMEKNLISMAREVEKLRAEIANAEKRARAAAAANPTYAGSYGGGEVGYAANPYPSGYGAHPAPSGQEMAPQYGAPAQNPWGAYDMQRAHGRR